MAADSFAARSELDVGGTRYEIFRLDALQERFDVARLPYTLRILLENVLRHEDGQTITTDDVEAVARWVASDDPSREISFTPARVLLQATRCATSAATRPASTRAYRPSS